MYNHLKNNNNLDNNNLKCKYYGNSRINKPAKQQYNNEW